MNTLLYVTNRILTPLESIYLKLAIPQCCPLPSIVRLTPQFLFHMYSVLSLQLWGYVPEHRGQPSESSELRISRHTDCPLGG